MVHGWSCADTGLHVHCWVVAASWQESPISFCTRGLLCTVTQVARVRSGVRALPQKTGDGAIPLAGKLPSGGDMHKYIPNRFDVKYAHCMSCMWKNSDCVV